jgi:uncharacterized OB-fold protein
MTDTDVNTRAGQERLKELGILPVPEPDERTREYWEAAARGELRIARCDSCGTFRHPPTPSCRACGSEAMAWTAVSGTGTVYSFIVDHRLMVPGFDEPYVVAQVNPDDAPPDTVRVVANIKDCAPGDVYIGMPVEVFFEQRGTATLPQFRPRRDA